ncbi:MAG: T9SS type A sorting domain-containing protein [Flavobacteriales bacterium]|nr:T9SS type A sorting domain-containing protein [Flavobacteriales bacterium]MBK9534069.1 T9SS type A sorting domain-containing protein [Flavobacteriales bacterium]MBP9137464.1 T9SS type A sorting domain-containing protein [Flavobacteriales bacterium]HQX29265.1 T9SS type A sorting domain-containing protein [Flavobacteriales bacterium]HQX37864.1 T9SS type A sorting domain-containing protein [Flavobacteriales bacterium]
MKRLSFTSVCCLLGLLVFAQPARIMTWNALNFSTASQDRVVYFQTVVDSLQPDILVVQEVEEEPAAAFFQSAVLGGSMAMAPFVDGFGTDNALYYNATVFEAVANIPIQTDLRDISQFVLVHLASGDTLRVFSVHLKSSSGSDNQDMRLNEVNALRQVTDQLPADSYFIVCGDFNTYGSNEPAYQRLLSTTGSGYFIDPIVLSGIWNNANYAPHHTQSTRSTAFGGGASGAMDDRFDMILFSPNLLATNGVTYVTNSTWAVGNDGQHYNQSINAMPNASVSQTMADALYYAADHLPVVASIEFFNRVSVEERVALNTLTVYPNPSHGTITVELPADHTSTVTVLDATGRMVYSDKGIGSLALDLNSLTGGVYYLKVTSSSEERVVKLLLL